MREEPPVPSAGLQVDEFDAIDLHDVPSSVEVRWRPDDQQAESTSP